ncbi:MAG: undecaprenyl-diphosphate phosphatase [Candidatus Omnitrophota bacterium]
MTLSQSVMLGIVQGTTEFLPISSSGHLVLIQGLFGMKEGELAFDIFLHLGTLISILIYFRRDILDIIVKDRRLALYVAAASVPTFMIGMMFKDAAEELFARPHIVGYMLLATGLWLLAAALYSRFARSGDRKKLGFVNSLIMGAAQGIAVIPGISRSGATIGAGILSGIDKEKAVRFSFLLAIPAIAGASLLKCRDIGAGLSSGDALSFTAGAIVAMITGLASISVLLKMVKTDKLYIFGIYCILAASFVIVYM